MRANFTTLLASYNVVQAGLTGTGTTTWNATTNQTGFTTTTIVGISAANKGNILLRFNSLSTTAAAVVERLLKRNRILPLFAAEIPTMVVVVKPV